MTHAPRCPACREPFRFGTDLAGRLLESCRCGERPVPVTGTRGHDQREVLERDLLQHATSGMTRPSHPGQPRSGHRLLPLGVRTRKDAEP